MYKKSREGRANTKEMKRRVSKSETTKKKVYKKDVVLKMVEALIVNGREKHGICRHNHDIGIMSSGKIKVDGQSAGYVEPQFIKAAKFLLDHGYYVEYVRNSPVIYDYENEPSGVTIGDLYRGSKI